MPGHDRGSGKELHARLRQAYCLPQRRRRRHPPRCRHRLHGRGDHALLRFAAGQGHGQGPRSGRGNPAHEPRPARVSRPRRGLEPDFPREHHPASVVQERRMHDALHRHHAGTVHLQEAPRPGHPTTQVHRRRRGQWQPGDEGPAAAASAAVRSYQAEGRSHPRSAGRQPRPLQAARRTEVRRLDA